jgi:hypothetical protein
MQCREWNQIVYNVKQRMLDVGSLFKEKGKLMTLVIDFTRSNKSS